VFIWLSAVQPRSAGALTAVGFGLFYTLAFALFTTLHPLF